jgi:hypothetical protein
MKSWFSWGGLRGRGISLKNDAFMSVVALTMATVVLILAYMLFERNAVKVYCETNIDPGIEQTDFVVQRIEKVWDSNLMMKTPDALNPEIDVSLLRSTAASLNRQLKRDTKELHAMRVEYSKKPEAPNPCVPCFEKTGAYVRTADNYATVMQEVIKYLHDLVLIEAPMNEAVRAVQMGGANVSPEALLNRDAVVAAQLDKIKALKPPPLMKQFHDDTVTFFTDYLTVNSQITAAYIASGGLVGFDTLGQEGETVLNKGRARLKDDITALKSLMQGGQAKLLRSYRQSAREQMYSLKSKYRF